MGMQVLSVSAGSAVLSQQEKRPQSLGEQKASVEKMEASLPGFLAGTKKQSQELQKTTAELERVSLAFDRRLKFIIDPDSHQVLIKVIDNETDKVIKVLPPEELQRLHGRIRETMGFLFDAMV